LAAFPSNTALPVAGRWATLLLIATLLLTSTPAAAEQRVVFKRGRFLEQGKLLSVTAGFREMFSAKMKKRLRSGFTTTVVMWVYLYSKQDSRPIAGSVRTLRAVYDLWEERYVLRMQDHRGTRNVRLRSEKKVVDRLTSLWRFPIADLRKIKPGTKYFVAVRAEVNPMSEKLLSEVRRWLRNPHGGHRKVGGESFFGSFVSIFVNNKIRRAEKTFKLKTQPFFRKSPP
jgi:Domain of unknown function (DUF4390)